MVKLAPHPLSATSALTPAERQRVRLRCAFEHHKWDPQVGDVDVLADFALTLSPAMYRELARLAEALAAETVVAEREIASRPELHGRLGLSRPLRRALRTAVADPADGPRFLRFDFHPTTGGWRLSEVNSDVPGGFIEAGGFTRLTAEHFPGLIPPPEPATALAAAVRAGAAGRAPVALVHATAYADDRQVMRYLADHLATAGLQAVLVAPDQIDWREGYAHIETDWHRGPAGAIIRFFPGEWLPNLPRSSRWRHFFGGARTPLANPATALLTQSKRFPLVWDALAADMPTWRRLLPDTCDPRRVPAGERERWVLKPALGRVGEDICLSGVTPEKRAVRLRRLARWFPGAWAAQRRFESVAVPTPHGPAHVCLGLYTVDGQAAGIYGRLSAQPLIDSGARDVAVLIEPASPPAPAAAGPDTFVGAVG